MICALSHFPPVVRAHVLHALDRLVGLCHVLLCHPSGALIEFLTVKSSLCVTRVLQGLQLLFEVLVLVLQSASLLQHLVCEFYSRIHQD